MAGSQPPERVAAGPAGGSGNEAGSGFRAGVAAYVAAYMLRGQPFAELKLEPWRAVPVSLELEAGSAVDDLRVELADGTAFVQAKRRMDRSRSGPTSFIPVVAQWIALVREQRLEPERTRLVAVAGSMSQSIFDLGRALERRRQQLAGPPSAAEHEALEYLVALLADLTEDERKRVLDSAIVWRADLEETTDLSSRFGQSLLEPGVVEVGHGVEAWRTLRENARDLARRRYGATLEDLTALLRDAGHPLVAQREGFASARAEERRAALAAYRARVRERGETIDLAALNVPIQVPRKECDGELIVRWVAPPREPVRTPVELTLTWALRRLGRALLLGAPGEGKSVALHAAAGNYAGREGWPLPLVVPLRRLVPRLAEHGFLDAMLDVALEDEPADVRALLRAAALESLASGDAALFFDGLDETRGRRHEVVAEMRTALSGMHPAVEVLVATRDSAYADARTLEFSELRLEPVDHCWGTLETVLSYCHDLTPPPYELGWVDARADWVTRRLRSRALRSTPLMVVLLALLAADHVEDELPAARATALELLVHDVIRRWETGSRLRGAEPRIGPLSADPAVRAALEAFPLIAHALLEGVQPLRRDVEHALAATLGPRYGLAEGLAESLADGVLAMWDEAGVFVASGRPARLGARLSVFAELGEAMRVAALPAREQAAWIREHAREQDLRETALLTAELSADAAASLVELAAQELPDTALLRLVQRGASTGVPFAPEPLGQLVGAVLERLPSGDETAARALVALPVPPQWQGRARATLDALPQATAVRARAATVHSWARPDAQADDDLLALMRLGFPRGEAGPFADEAWDVVGLAADRLLPRGDDDIARLFLGSDGSRLDRPSIELEGKLRQAGFDALVDRHAEARRRRETEQRRREQAERDPVADPPGTYAILPHDLPRLIAELAEPARLGRLERRGLDDLVSLLHSLGLSSSSVIYIIEPEDLERLRAVLRASVQVTGLELGRIAAQAAELDREIESGGEIYDGSVAAFDVGGRQLRFDRWDQVAAPSELLAALAHAIGSHSPAIEQAAVRCLLALPDALHAELLSLLPPCQPVEDDATPPTATDLLEAFGPQDHDERELAANPKEPLLDALAARVPSLPWALAQRRSDTPR